MKRLFLIPLLTFVLVSCAKQAPSTPTATSSSSATPQAIAPATPNLSPDETTASPTPDPDADLPQVGEFSLDQLSSRGCGMTLWKPERENRDRFVFFNGVNPGSMEMMIDGQMVKFNRIEASGEEFYGQKTSQTFRSEDGSTTVKVDVDLGTLGEVESVAINEATVKVSKNGQEVILTLLGDAGC